MNKLPKVSVRKGREWQLCHGHPWLFSGAISQSPKTDAGALVDVVDTDGRFVARGYYNANCDIAVRVLSRDPDEQIDGRFFQKRILDAQQLRQLSIDASATDVYRLINAEADLLPGYIVDYFGGVVVVQSHTAGADRLLDEFLQALQAVVDTSCVILRNDAGVRKREGLSKEEPTIVSGTLPAGGGVVVRENSLSFYVDPLQGQKTGFYTDQRDKRFALRLYSQRISSPSVSMLNCFSYTGAFAVYCCANRSPASPLSSVNVDQSERVLEEARRNFALNAIPLDCHQFVCADAFEWLEEAVQSGTMFDISVLDPPAFAKSAKDKNRAIKAYTRMNRLGIAVTKPGGIMVTCSCSGPVSFDEFVQCLKDAAGESGRHVQIMQVFQNSSDHPVSAVATESGYLKVIFCRVL